MRVLLTTLVTALLLALGAPAASAAPHSCLQTQRLVEDEAELICAHGDVPAGTEHNCPCGRRYVFDGTRWVQR